jgi:hypothetical protein
MRVSLQNCTSKLEIARLVQVYQQALVSNPKDRGCFSVLKLQEPAAECQITSVVNDKSEEEMAKRYYDLVLSVFHLEGVELCALDRFWQDMFPKEHFDDLLKRAGIDFSDEVYQSLRDAALKIRNRTDRSTALLDLLASLRRGQTINLEKLSEIGKLVKYNVTMECINNIDSQMAQKGIDTTYENLNPLLNLPQLLQKIRSTGPTAERKKLFEQFYHETMSNGNLQEGLKLLCSVDNNLEICEFLESFGVALREDPNMTNVMREVVIAELVNLNVDFSIIQLFFSSP